MEILHRFIHNDYELFYLSDSHTVCMQVLPLGMEPCPEKRAAAEPLLHAFVRGDVYGGQFTAGLSMRLSETTKKLRMESIRRAGDTVITELRAGDLRFIHSCRLLDECIEVETTAENYSDGEVTLDLLTSFSMGGLTPLVDEEEPGSLKLVRIQSFWSGEARREIEAMEDLSLEPAPGYNMDRIVKFGTLGSMPVRTYYPRCAVEDTVFGVTWAFDLDASSSWQIECVRKDRGVSVTGGMGDYDYAGWAKTLNPGQRFTAPSARITVCRGDSDCAFQRLTRTLKDHAASPAERDLPFIYNEYCTTGGNPLHDNIIQIANRLKGMDFAYLVIDAGWFVDIDADWGRGMGDWNVSRQRFPEGLRPVCARIREAGMIPGLWYELEVVGPDTQAWNNTEHLLKRGGKVLTVNGRRFWDMRDEWVRSYLRDKVIKNLKDNGFGFIKVDYNDSIGRGCDGAESEGEALRLNIEATKEFFLEMRREIPELVIENCSSGGHREESGMMRVSDLASFSDCCEGQEVPVIAANQQRVVLPEQNEIWAVLRSQMDDDTICYRMINTLYGRLCMSGEIYALNGHQWELASLGLEFYKKASDIIKNGETVWLTQDQRFYRDLRGAQVTLRVAGNRALLICHRFVCGEQMNIRVEEGWKTVCHYGNSGSILNGETLTVNPGSYTADAWILEK